MVNAARMCVPVHWRSTSSPSIPEWFEQINRVAEMELIYITLDKIPKFTNIWEPWTTFKSSQLYEELT